MTNGLTAARAFLALTILAAPQCAAVLAQSATAADGVVTDLPLIALVLQKRDELQLTDGQVKDIEGIRADFRRRAIPNAAALRVAEIERDELLAKKPLDSAALTASLNRIDEMRNRMRADKRDFDARVRVKLTDAQRARLESFITAEFASPSDPFAPDLRQQVQAVLKEHYQQQDVVEITVAQAVVTKVLDWAKILGVLVGVPLTLLLAVIGWYGFSSTKDVKERVEKFKTDVDAEFQRAKTSIEIQVEQARQSVDEKVSSAHQSLNRKIQEENQRINALKAQSAAVEDGYRDLEARLVELRKLPDKMKELASRMTRIETFVIRSSGGLGSEAKEALVGALRAFEKYFQDLGFEPADPVDVNIDTAPGLIFNPRYIPQRNAILLAPIMAGDADVLFRLYAHYVLVPQGKEERVRQRSYRAIEFGLSVYYVLSYRGKTTFGDKILPLLRKEHPTELLKHPNIRVYNLKNNLKLDAIDLTQFKDELDRATEAELTDFKVQLAKAGETWGGALWEIREAVGKEDADETFYRSWLRLLSLDDGGNPSRSFAELILKHFSETDDALRVARLREIFARRGLILNSSGG